MEILIVPCKKIPHLYKAVYEGSKKAVPKDLQGAWRRGVLIAKVEALTKKE